MHAARDRAVR